jgi:L-iditol 2-dehydrogenase
MRAAVYKAVKRIEFQDRPMLKADSGEVVVKIKYCGICGTDVHMYFEGILPPGVVLGHENVGTVAEVGEGVDGWKVGDRVIAGPRRTLRQMLLLSAWPTFHLRRGF